MGQNNHQQNKSNGEKAGKDLIKMTIWGRRKLSILTHPGVLT
jgi:hypothetical protein